jgi:hypothetical protein
LTPTKAPAKVEQAPRQTALPGTTVMLHLNLHRFLSKDGGKLSFLALMDPVKYITTTDHTIPV